MLHTSNSYKGVKHINNANLPKIGFIALVFDQPVAAGFLRMVEGGFGQIDTLVTDASVHSFTRHIVLNALVEKLIETAKSMELKAVYAHTTDKTVIIRAKDHGFMHHDDSLISLKL